MIFVVEEVDGEVYNTDRWRHIRNAWDLSADL